MKENRIGIEFTTNEGSQVIVIDYINCDKVQVMFLDEHKYTTWTNWGNLKKGTLKNPFHKSIYGVGYLGIDENGQVPKCTDKGKPTREYNVWKSMFVRCYSDKFHEQYPTYKNCTVAEEWHNFSKFLQDMPKIENYDYWKNNPKKYIALNKDIYYTNLGIQTDSKEYSLLTTRFIDNEENVKEVYKRKD